MSSMESGTKERVGDGNRCPPSKVLPPLTVRAEGLGCAECRCTVTGTRTGEEHTPPHSASMSLAEAVPLSALPPHEPEYASTANLPQSGNALPAACRICTPVTSLAIDRSASWLSLLSSDPTQAKPAHTSRDSIEPDMSATAFTAQRYKKHRPQARLQRMQ